MEGMRQIHKIRIKVKILTCIVSISEIHPLRLDLLPAMRKQIPKYKSLHKNNANIVSCRVEFSTPWLSKEQSKILQKIEYKFGDSNDNLATDAWINCDQLGPYFSILPQPIVQHCKGVKGCSTPEVAEANQIRTQDGYSQPLHFYRTNVQLFFGKKKCGYMLVATNKIEQGQITRRLNYTRNENMIPNPRHGLHSIQNFKHDLGGELKDKIYD